MLVDDGELLVGLFVVVPDDQLAPVGAFLTDGEHPAREATLDGEELLYHLLLLGVVVLV